MYLVRAFVMQDDDYVSVNRDLWNTKTNFHLDSPYYNVKEFLADENYVTLKSTELKLLDNIQNKRILHLQCHFGLDTLSLGRLGAKKVIGVDLSDVAIENARRLAGDAHLDHLVEFICCDIYQIEDYLKINDENDFFDVIFTSYGTTKWFPDLNKWAGIIEKYLKPNGTFLIIDFHPMLWTFDDQFEILGRHSYFNQGSIVEYTKGTYADPDAPIQQKSVRWNHSLAEIITALIGHHLTIDLFQEFDNLPLNCFRNLCQISDEELYHFKDYKGKLPLAYAIKATKANSKITE